MNVPASMHIEMALDRFKNAKAAGPGSLADELSELREVGAAAVATAEFPAGTSDLEKGYLLGLETARAMQSLNPAVRL